MFKFTAKNAEIIEKVKNGKRYEELAKEYNTSVSAIGHMVRKHELFKAYCDEMERLIGKSEINQETKLYELSKLLKFDTRSINALIAKNIRGIDELLSLTEEEIYSIKNIGKTSRNHINKSINEYKENFGRQITMFEMDEDIKEISKSVDVKDTEVEKQISKPILGLKANRNYIYKLFKLADDRQVNIKFLQKEISNEFDRIEKVNKELLQVLSELYYARRMPWTDEKAEYKIDSELKLEEILDMYK